MPRYGIPFHSYTIATRPTVRPPRAAAPGARGLSSYARYLPMAASVAKAAYNMYKGTRAQGGLSVKPLYASSKQKTKLKRARKRLAKRKGRSIPKKVRKLAKAVKSLQLKTADSTGHLTYYFSQTTRCLALQNVAGYTTNTLAAHDISNIEAALAETRYFNPAVPGTLTQASQVAGTYHRENNIKSVYSCLTVANNYQVPAIVQVVCWQAKGDTSLHPQDAFTNGIADVGAPAATSPYLHYSDSPQLLELWKPVVNKTVTLGPGQTLKESHAIKNIQYDSSLTDSHAENYQTRYKCFTWTVRVVGVLGHDSAVTTEHGFLPAGVDIHALIKYCIEYDAGIDLKYIVITSGLDNFTNGGLVSSKPVADNVGYSLA